MWLISLCYCYNKFTSDRIKVSDFDNFSEFWLCKLLVDEP